MVILSDNAREVGMNLLDNAWNNMVDSFRSIKWIFHEMEDIKNRLHGLERKEGEDEIEKIRNLDSRVTKMEKRMERMESSLHSTVNQSLNIIKGLNDNIN